MLVGADAAALAAQADAVRSSEGRRAAIFVLEAAGEADAHGQAEVALEAFCAEQFGSFGPRR